MIDINPARRAGVPLVSVDTSDPAQTIRTIIGSLNGDAEDAKVLRWDFCNGMVGVTDAGAAALSDMVGNEDPKIATLNPAECLSLLLAKLTPDLMVFFLNIDMVWTQPDVIQGIWNLRDKFKSNGSMLIALGSGTRLPAQLKQDCVTLIDTLPDVKEVRTIVDQLAEDAGIQEKFTKHDREKACDTILGLSAFAGEQVLAMSLTKKGVDLDSLWERKRQMIEQTPGLSVWKGGERFDDIGGYENAKSFMRNICNGNAPPRAIVFIDEIEKSMAGNRSDSSGVSQDYLRTLLTFMQDKDAAGVIFIGPPGSGKSAVAKSTGNEAEIPTVALDLGGMKGSLVGESEQRLRTALQVIDAISQGRTLFIATCNSIGVLPPELRRRFSLGTFFFPLPTEKERRKVWDIYRRKFSLHRDDSLPDDDGWTGAEIRNCCNIAWRLNCTLEQAAKFIVPVSKSAADDIERLCREASGRYISAGEPGMYKQKQEQQSSSRRLRT